MADLVLFDIDGTLFDPRKFGVLYRAELIKILGIEEDALSAAIADYYATLETTTDFDPHGLAAYLASRFSVDKEKIDGAIWNKSHFKEAVFEDALPTVQALSKSKTLGIFSQGFVEFQKYKLENTGLLKYFDPEQIFIHKRKADDTSLAAIPKDATVIEDKHDVAETLSSICSVVWINRRTPDADPKLRTIHSLSELV